MRPRNESVVRRPSRALRRFYPTRFETYREPFVGGGAVFFDLVSRGAVRQSRVRLTDINPDLTWRRTSSTGRAVRRAGGEQHPRSVLDAAGG